ncbi:putative DNA (cytosine-5-)-methyltransferase [Megalodesulfovibrio gigas DSM 1382 = ATCC 19364]|uniref:DNA (cytosine-5-)-methyltransferase n=2 Tax=Megalodesulfovibrio gigas TaxID=879 RepID=T2GBV7_MEGG1|nr:putative DNA (cytosine-5-)-methyltransferase [Megalodesulfovibrio gigas DSM 1382 = ATCC 19364]
MTLRAVDFFCGGGGMTCGLRMAGINVLGGLDIAADCRETYEFNNRPSRFVEQDVAGLDAEALGSIFDIRRDAPNLIFVGCSPCQYWSKIRTDRGKSEKSAFLLKEFQRFIDSFLPGFVVLENVPGLRSNPQSYLPHFRDFLKNSGYSFADDVIDTSRYGVPQHRHRYLLVASRTCATVTLPIGDTPTVSVRQVIGEKNGFPRIAAGHADNTNFMHTSAELSALNLRRIQTTPHDGGDRLSWKDDPELQIDAYKGRDDIFKDVYGRIRWDTPAPTITTRFNSLSNGRFGHPEEDRALSLREGACLQTFPKSYRFFGPSRNSVARQIGNAVPPLLARHIGKHLIRLSRHGDI